MGEGIDPQKAAEFVSSELPRVFNLCTKLCFNRQDAEDLCQEVFVKALNALASFRGASAASTWLYRITLNAWKNRIRYESRRKFNKHISLDGPKNEYSEREQSLELPSNEPTPDSILLRKENRGKILEALDQLDQDQKGLIVLRDIEGKSYEEIAEILEINLGTVKSRLSRARDAYREILLRSKEAPL